MSDMTLLPTGGGFGGEAGAAGLGGAVGSVKWSLGNINNEIGNVRF